MTLVLHHIAGELAAVVILVEEIAKVLSELTGGPPAALPEVRHTYAEFIREQRALVASAQGLRQFEYWRGRLGDPCPPLQIPTARPRPVVKSFRGAMHGFSFPKGIAKGVRDLGKRNKFTPFEFLLATYFAFLHRYTNDVWRCLFQAFYRGFVFVQRSDR